MTPDLTPAQNALLVYLLENLPVEPVASLLEASLEGSERRHLTGHSGIVGDDSIKFVFTLPDTIEHSFLAATDGEPAEISVLLSNLERMEMQGTHLCPGSSVLQPCDYLAKNGRVGVVLLSPKTLANVCQFEPRATIGGRDMRFSLVVFLDEEEYAFELAHGHDALMKLFDERRKDLVAIRADRLL